MSTRHPALWRSLMGAIVLSLVPTAAGAVEHEVRILLDLDDDSGTGCLVNTVEGSFDGVEQVLITTVETTASPDAGTVTDAATADCTDPVTDTFGVPTSFDGGWPVGIGNGEGGRDVVETYFPLVASLVDEPRVIRLGVVVTDEQGGEQALLTVDGSPGGEPIVLDLRSVLEIPTLGEWGLILLTLLLAAASVALLGRRGTATLVVALVVLASGIAWAAEVLDGLTDDWSPADLLASNGLVLFGKGAPGQLCFRVDVDLLFNQAPTITDIPDQTIPEDGATGPLAFTVGDFESPATSLTVSATSSNQVLVPDGNLTLGGSGANRTIEVTPAADQNGMADVTVTVEDPDGGTGSTTFRVTVTSDNDAPTISAIGDETILEDGTTGPLAFTVDDVETAPGDLAVTAASNDQTIIPDGNLVLGGSGSNRTIEVVPAADQFGGPVTITVTVEDTDGGSVAEQLDVTVDPVNDPPSFDLAGNVSSDEDAGPQTVNDQAVNISPGPVNEAGQTVTFQVTNDDNALFTAAGQPDIDTSGTLTYESAPDANGSATVTVVAQDDGGTADGGSDTSASQTFQITVNPVNDPPAVTSSTISYDAVGNTLLRVPGNDPDHDGGVPGRIASTSDPNDAFVKAGPSDIDSASVAFQAGTSTTTQGGSLTIDDDGDFHYTPPTGFTGTDDVVVNVVDGDGGSTPVTIEITVSELVWYVEDTTDSTKNPSGGPGTSRDAFETLGAAEAASGEGDFILVFETDASLEEGIALKSGQKLYGQPVEDEATPLLPGGMLLEEIADTDARPVLSPAALDTDAVEVAATGGSLVDVEIRHLELSGTGSGNAIDVTSTDTHAVGVTIADNRIAESEVDGIDLNPGSSGDFTVAVENNSFSTTAIDGAGIDATTVAGNSATVQVAIDGNTDVTSGFDTAIHLDGSQGTGSLFVTSFANNTVHGDNGGTGVFLDTVTFDADPSDGDFSGDQVAGGTLAVGVSGDGVGGSGLVLESVSGDLAFTDLDLFADGGTGLLVTGTGPLNAGAGTGFRIAAPAGSTVAATGGPAVDVDPATVALTFDSLSSSGSATRGVSLVDVAGTFSASAGSITGSAGDAFHVASSLASPLDVAYGGTITNSAGRLILADGLPVGSDLLFDGTSLSDTGGTGIAVNDFDGVLTVTAAGTSITNSTSTGFAATGDTDGTVNLDDVTITDPAGTAVHVVDPGGGMGGALDLDNVDVSQGANAALLVDVQGLNNGSVSFDSASALSATAGTGVNVASNAGTSPVGFGGPIDLGTSGSPLSAGTAFTMSANSTGTTVTAPDVDVFTSGQTAVSASGAGTLDLDALSISTVSNGRALDLNGIVSLVDVDSVTCSHDSHCVDLTNLGAGSTTTFAAADLTCSGGTCFNATAGRTVEVTGAGNTISATNAGGIDLTNTTIGGGGVTWESISSTGGATPGIVLDTTGTTGGFNLTGDGGASNNGSGGTIASKTGDAVFLDSARDVSLAHLNIGQAGALSNVQDNGVRAHAVENFTLHRSNLRNVADQNLPDEAALFATEPRGTWSVTNSLFDRSFDDHIRIENSTTTSGFAFNLLDSTLQDNNASGNGNDALLYLADGGGTDATLTIQRNAFDDSDGDHVQIALNGPASADVTIGGPDPADGNTLTATPGTVLGSGITLSSGADSSTNGFQGLLTYVIQNNDIQDPEAAGINVNLSASSTAGQRYTGSIVDNVIGTSGSSGSGGFGIQVTTNGAGTSTALIEGNSVLSWDGANALRLTARDGSNRLNTTVRDNAFLEPTPAGTDPPEAAVEVASGAAGADTTVLCLDITDADVDGDGNNDFDVPTDPDFGDMFFGTQGSGSVLLAGYGGPDSDAGQIESFVQGGNVGTPTVNVFNVGGPVSGAATNACQ